jgi:dual specificity tyrosine-phosphorylation-regulated kinase 2/3/4
LDLHRFDDERGDYVLRKHDHLAFRYELLGILGRGSFGQVVRCMDHFKKTQVAVKIIRNRARFQTQAQVEIHILSTLKEKVQ